MEHQAKKQKTAHNGQPKERKAYSSSNMAARFAPIEGGREYTVSIAVPSSILSNLNSNDQRMSAPGRIARAAAIFNIDEIILFDDSPRSTRPPAVDTAAYTGDSDPTHFLSHIISFLEAPPFMRKALFPLHPNLRLTALLPTLEMPHHPHPKEWMPYREGVTTGGKKEGGTVVDVGDKDTVVVKDEIPAGTRVTLRMPEEEGGRAECVHPDIPRTEGGYYWGYSVRKAGSLSSVFTESPYENGYDLSIGTSERGTPASKTFPASKKVIFKHLLIVFGGPRGLEYASMNDEELNGMNVQGARTKELFDHWVDVLPNQGSRNIKTDEAVFIALTALRGIWDSN